MSAHLVIWGSVLVDHVFSLFRGAHGESSPRAQIRKVVQLVRPILDKALGWL